MSIIQKNITLFTIFVWLLLYDNSIMYYLCGLINYFMFYLMLCNMIRIKDKLTGNVFTYSGANKEFATKDSFCTNNKTGVQFRRNWHGVVDYFMENQHFTQCLLNDRFEVIL